MNVMKKVLLLLLAIVICFQHSIGNPDEIKKEGDAFLEYLLTKSEITNNDNLLTLVGKAYESLGLHENALELFSHLQSDQNKYTLLDHSINAPSKKDLKDFERIEKQISSLGDKTLIIKLLLDLISQYNEIGVKSKVFEAYKKCYDEINLLENDDDFEDKIFLSTDLSFTLLNCGLQKEGNKILIEVDRLNEESKDIYMKMQIYEYIIYSCIEINDEEKANQYAAKINDLLMSAADIVRLNNLNLLEAFISLGKHEYACALANKIIKYKKGPSTLKEIYYLMAVSKLLTCEILDVQLLQKESGVIGETLIQLLIEAGEVKKAKEMSEKLDTQNGNTQNRDAYCFYLGKKYLNESSSRILKLAALNLAYKINDINQKIEFMSEIALAFQKNDETDTFMRIMNDITILTEGKNFAFGHGKKDLALVFLEAGFPDKALQLIETIEDKLSQASDLYEFGVYALTQCNKPLAEKVLHRFDDESIYKGLLLSKIASWYLIQGERDIALQLLKKAFDIIKKTDEGFLPSLIDDYINARVNGRIIEKFLE